MKRNRFTDEQIVGLLKEHEAGNACRGSLLQALRQRCQYRCDGPISTAC